MKLVWNKGFGKSFVYMRVRLEWFSWVNVSLFNLI